MKTLYLVRHAKSSWDNANMSDFDRPLNSRGEKAAPLMAQKMLKASVVPDLIITSPAKRALSTAEVFSDMLDYPVERIEQRMEIYEGGIQHMLKLVQEIDDSCNTVLLFGHNPNLTIFTHFLTSKHIQNVATCGIVKILMPHEHWNETMMDSGNFQWYDYPKKQ
ncbi:putative phosphohistidine phosphatase, SixA [Prosthecochloris aestuarii DSM 271]|uniref:Phosphohistidine phosphatase, SixA n=1 Tax=Prosthecochloris aestuarii (strain DSM 271 / SK 413) TaxID=290512 RepID=B4S673_PROA2|nr:histidine phosphatase family protein [Prosthecochloris aestuarii]ACF47175.1 putative phosphohistidine phosphatase, SixA [Prosthecochloris aestuarii DSM 271]